LELTVGLLLRGCLLRIHLWLDSTLSLLLLLLLLLLLVLANTIPSNQNSSRGQGVSSHACIPCCCCCRPLTTTTAAAPYAAPQVCLLQFVKLLKNLSLLLWG
jgi:hypothetical protein